MLDHISSKAVVPDRSSSPSALSRRGFLQAAAVGGGLMLSLQLPFAEHDAQAADADFAPNAFIRIGGDGQVVLIMPYVEMGQGTYTSIPMLIAEELEVELTHVRLEHAPPNEKFYGNPLAGVLRRLAGVPISLNSPGRLSGTFSRTGIRAASAASSPYVKRLPVSA